MLKMKCKVQVDNATYKLTSLHLPLATCHLLVNTDLPENPKRPNTQPTDWTMCALYQDQKSEALQCLAWCFMNPLGLDM